MKVSPFTIKNSVARKKTTPAPAPKYRPPVQIRSCVHALNGAVWCQVCANTFLSQARALYARALRESGRGEVIRAAQDRLKKALFEYSLTPEGHETLERQYVKYASENRMVEARKIRSDIENFRSLASKRNIAAKKLGSEKSARVRALNAMQVKYSKPPVTPNGSYDLSECPYVLTQHALGRMTLRQVTPTQVKEAYNDSAAILPKGRGMWKITGKNNLVLVGHFDATVGEEGKEFVVATLFFVGSEDD